MAEERLDGLFMNAVQQSQGIENFFENIFGFMRRKTDFFTMKDQANVIVNKALEKHAKIFSEDKVR